MKLDAGDVADLQFFLLDVAKRYVVARGGSADEVADGLACAAALDYVLALASEYGGTIEDGAAIAGSIRETMTRAALAALVFTERMLHVPESVLDDFVERHVREQNVFGVLRTLRDGGVIETSDVAFRALTLAHDLLERRSG